MATKVYSKAKHGKNKFSMSESDKNENQNHRWLPVHEKKWPAQYLNETLFVSVHMFLCVLLHKEQELDRFQSKALSKTNSGYLF
jgi:hypothetical protein